MTDRKPDAPGRRLELEGVHNFRDFGGYAAGARRMASGRFFRSAHHALASDTDLAHIAKLGIATIIDLRRPDERANQPSRRWSGFSGQVIENDDHDEGENWHAFMHEWDMTAESFRAFLHRYYTRAPHMPRLLDLFSRYFDAVAEDRGPIVVHCAAGKDRTGLIVALTQTIAGVHRDDIIADYMLTNDPRHFASRGPVWAQQIEAVRGRAPTPAVMEVAMGVHPSLLELSLDAMAKRHGSVEGYLRDALKVDAGKRARIEKTLYES